MNHRFSSSKAFNVLKPQLEKKTSKPLYFCSLKQCILLYLPSFADCFNFPFGKIDLGWKLRQNVVIRWWQYKTKPKMCQKSILRYQPRHFGFHSCRLATKSHHVCRRPWCFIDMPWLYIQLWINGRFIWQSELQTWAIYQFIPECNH